MALAAYLQPAHPREILVRMLHNLKSVFTESKDWEHLLGVQQRLVILLPDEAEERRDRGLAYEHLECPQAALDDFESYLAEHPYAADAEQLRSKLPDLRAAVRRLN
jgi:regulator of sirC expression with transglutaminase-like and TPR domain